MDLSTKLTFLLFLLIVIYFHSYPILNAQTDDVSMANHFNENFSNTILLEDLDFIIDKVEDKPIGRDPYNFITKDEFYKKIEIVKTSITAKDSMTRKEFYNLVGPLISLVKDDHASLRVSSNWKRNVLKRNFSVEKVVIPLSILISDAMCYVVASNTLPVKSNVISINEIPISDIITRCSQYVNTNEYCAVKKGMMTVFNFPKNASELWAIYGFEDSVNIKYIPFGLNKEESITIKLFQINDKTFIQDFKVVPLKMAKKPDIEIRDETAILILPTFRMGKDRDKDLITWTTFFNNAFKEINDSEVKNIIIDISNNGGGSEQIPNLLYNYISNKKIKLTYYSAENHPSIFVEQFSDSLKKEIAANYFNGNVYLLISGMSFSAAARFADVFKSNSMGEIIGRETKAFRTHYGEMKWYALPNTKLGFRISSKFFVSASGDKEPHGVIPDYEIEMTSMNSLFDRFGDNYLLEQAFEYVKSK